MKRSSKTNLMLIGLTLLILTAISLSGLFSERVTAQTGNSIVVNNGMTYTNSTNLQLTLTSNNATLMRFSNDNSSWSNWEAFSTQKNYTAMEGDKNYTISVQFQDNQNNTSTASTFIFVDTTPPEPVPYADWYTNDYRTVYFDGSDSTDNWGIANYTWNFGDGNTTSGIRLIHTYQKAGNYTAALSVIDYGGNNVTVTFPAIIPDITSVTTPTPTPTPTTYIPATLSPTSTPTVSPTSTTSSFDTNWVIAIAAIIVIAILGSVIILFMRRSSKNQASSIS